MGARLWLRAARRKDGRIIANAVWIIRDSGRDYATGCLARSADKKPPPEAERALAKHIANAVELAGVDSSVTPHVLRHTAAT